MEANVLSAMVYKRSAFDLLIDVADIDDFSVFGKGLFKIIKDYYLADDQAEQVDLSILLARAERQHPKHRDNFKAIIDSLVPVSVPNVLEEYVDVRVDSLSHKLAGLLSEGLHNKETDRLLRDIIDLKDLKEQALGDGEAGKELNAVPVADVFETLKEDKLVKFFPDSLCEAMGGGVPRPCHVVMFARPNAGKSLLGISLTCDFLRQGLKALYIGNEDASTIMLSRIISNLSGMTKYEVLGNLEEAQERAEDSGYNNLHFIDKASCSLDMVRSKVKKIRPDVIVVDQLRNMEDSNNKRSRVDSLDYIARSIRNIGKDHNCVTLSITQAGERAHNVLVLDMEHVDGSKTGIQASCEFMIGIGMNEDFKLNNKRMISIPKSKNPDAKLYFPVKINPHLSRIYDL